MIRRLHTLMNEPGWIQASVGIPCYNGQPVAWMTMESYCRQWPVFFNWEVIVCEEPHEKMIGVDFFKAYLPRLKARGCRRFTYIELVDWVNLPEKWKIIGQHVASTDGVFIKHAVDCYAPVNRLVHSYHAIVDQGYDWADVRIGYFYSFLSQRVMVYRKAGSGPHLHMAFKSKYAGQLRSSEKNKGVDSHLKSTIKQINPDMRTFTHSSMLPGSVDTDGYNNISTKRHKQYIEPTKPCFFPTMRTLSDIGLPMDVVQRMKTL